MTMTSKRQRRPTMPLQPPRRCRRQRGLATIACALALTSLGPRCNDRNDYCEMDREWRDIWPPSQSLCWLSTSPHLIHAASAAPTSTPQQAHNDSNTSNTNNHNDDSSLQLPPRPLNYYELLNLETPTTHRRKHKSNNSLLSRKKRSNYRSKLLTSDIKKAYRKQAQLYHPDKASRHNMTTAEATSKFAEIAEAYQTLVDPAQRYEYDWELLDMEEEYEEERLLAEEEQREKKRLQRQQQYYENYNNDNRNEMGDEDFSLYDKIRNGASNFQAWKDTLNLDPWAVFEDFFFQDSTMGGADSNAHIHGNAEGYARYQQNANANANADAYNKYQSYNNNNNQQQQQTRQSQHGQKDRPPRVSETTIYRGYDPAFGSDVYTVLRREEYLQNLNEKGEYYYRILGQDFISGSRVDPYTGFTMQEYYSAVTEPYFVEEGFSSLSSSRVGGENGSSNHQYASSADSQYRHRQSQEKSGYYYETKHRKSLSKLEEGEAFTPNGSESDPWLSPNGRYRAILLPTCELQIVSLDEQHQQKESQLGEAYDSGNNIVWNSETYIPDTRAHGCHLTLNSMGSLVLSVDYGSGIDSMGNTVLWNTPQPPVVPHWFQDDYGGDDGNSASKQQPVTFRYYASLDDDGVIAVYRVRERVSSTTDDGKSESEGQGRSSSHEGHSNASTSNNKSSSRSSSSSSSSSEHLRIRGLIDKIGGVYHRISKTSAQHGQTKAALAWDQLRYNVGRILSGRPWIASAVPGDEDPNQPNNHPNSYNSRHECIYSTSPVGCLAPGRNAIHLTKKVARTLKRSVQSMDSHLDHFLSVLTEPVASEYDYGDDYSYGYNSNNEGYGYANFNNDDEDEDVLDTLLRVTGAAGAQLGKAGMHGIHAAQIGMRRGRQAAGRVVGKMKDRMGNKHSSVRSWGERMMAEEEVVDDFF